MNEIRNSFIRLWRVGRFHVTAPAIMGGYKNIFPWHPNRGSEKPHAMHWDLWLLLFKFETFCICGWMESPYGAASKHGWTIWRSITICQVMEDGIELEVDISISLFLMSFIINDGPVLVWRCRPLNGQKNQQPILGRVIQIISATCFQWSIAMLWNLDRVQWHSKSFAEKRPSFFCY